MAFDRMQPIGDERMDFCIAQLCALLFNINRGKHASAKRVKDYMPKWSIESTRQSPAEIERRLREFANLHNIRIIEEQKQEQERGSQ